MGHKSLLDRKGHHPPRRHTPPSADSPQDASHQLSPTPGLGRARHPPHTSHLYLVSHRPSLCPLNEHRICTPAPGPWHRCSCFSGSFVAHLCMAICSQHSGLGPNVPLQEAVPATQSADPLLPGGPLPVLTALLPTAPPGLEPGGGPCLPCGSEQHCQHMEQKQDGLSLDHRMSKWRVNEPQRAHPKVWGLASFRRCLALLPHSALGPRPCLPPTPSPCPGPAIPVHRPLHPQGKFALRRVARSPSKPKGPAPGGRSSCCGQRNEHSPTHGPQDPGRGGTGRPPGRGRSTCPIPPRVHELSLQPRVRA